MVYMSLMEQKEKLPVTGRDRSKVDILKDPQVAEITGMTSGLTR